jgi:hypothetical protein
MRELPDIMIQHKQRTRLRIAFKSTSLMPLPPNFQKVYSLVPWAFNPFSQMRLAVHASIAEDFPDECNVFESAAVETIDK